MLLFIKKRAGEPSRQGSNPFDDKKTRDRPNGSVPCFFAERVKRKLNSASPTLDNLELVEFNPPDIKLLDKLEFDELFSAYYYVCIVGFNYFYN